MNINNAYNQYQNMNTAVSNPKAAANKTSTDVTSAETSPENKPLNLDTVSLSTPSPEKYLKAKYPAILYKTVDIPKTYGSWDSFKSQELFSAKPNIAKDTLAVYVHPDLQAKMDADPLYGLETARKAEAFFHAKTDGDDYTIGKNVSIIAYIDESGEIGEHWTSTIWPQLSQAESDTVKLDAPEADEESVEVETEELTDNPVMENTAETD